MNAAIEPSVTYRHVIILAAGDTPWQHSHTTGDLEGPFTGSSTGAILDALARDCDPALASDRVQYWERGGDLYGPRSSKDARRFTFNVRKG